MNCEPCTSKRKKRKKKKKKRGETCTPHRKEGESEIVNESSGNKRKKRGRRWRSSSCGYLRHSVLTVVRE